jgi:Rab5 GDP/GTP exchange factor
VLAVVRSCVRERGRPQQNISHTMPSSSPTPTSHLSKNLNTLSLSDQIDPWSRPVDDNDPEDPPAAPDSSATTSNTLNTPPRPDPPPPLPAESPPFVSSDPKVHVDQTVLDEFDPLGSSKVEQEAKLAWELSEPHPPLVPPKSSAAPSEPPTQDRPTPLPPPAPIPVPDPVPIPPTLTITEKPLPDPTSTTFTTQDPAQSIPRSSTPSLSGLAALARNFIPKSPARTSRPLSIDQASVLLSPTVATFGASTLEPGAIHKRSQSLGPALSSLNPDGSRPHTPLSAPRTPKSAAKDVDKDHPPFDFQLFLEQIKSKGAEPVAKYLRSWVPTIIKPSQLDRTPNHRFLTNFAKRSFTVNDQVKLIHDFLNASPKPLPSPQF